MKPRDRSTASEPLAGVENRNPDAHEFRASAKDGANFDLVYDSDEPAPVVDSGGNPTMSPRDVTKVNAAVTKRHDVIVALIGMFADELYRLARETARQ